jgi:prepilin-type N-terminal cleavage/methylation domain-containing protein
MRQGTRQGFTLTELLVASVLLAVVMTGVYSAFSSTFRIWRMGENNLYTLQSARTSMSVMERELNSMLGGAQHLFEGKDDEITFITVAQPLDVDHGEGRRVLWVRYHLNRPGKKLMRTEAVVKGALPMRDPDNKPTEETRLKLGRKKKFEMAADVTDFEIEYYWIPRWEWPDVKQPPPKVDPLTKDKNEQGWGVPQGVKLALTLKNPNSESGKTTFTTRITFNGPTSAYDEQRVGR